MLCNVEIARQRADTDAFVRELFDLGKWQSIDVDQLVRRLHGHFHQIDQICSATQKFSMRLAGNRCGGLICISRARVSERVHEGEGEKATRGLIALQSTSCETATSVFLFREAFAVRSRPRIAFVNLCFTV